MKKNFFGCKKKNLLLKTLVVVLFLIVSVSCDDSVKSPESIVQKQEIQSAPAQNLNNSTEDSAPAQSALEEEETDIKIIDPPQDRSPVTYTMALSRPVSSHNNAKNLSVSTGFVPGTYYKYKATPLFAYSDGSSVGGAQTSWADFCAYGEDEGSVTLEPGPWLIEIALPDSSGTIVYEGSAQISASKAFTGETIYLGPVMTETGDIDIDVQVTSITTGTTVTCYYAKTGSSESSLSLTSASAFSNGDSVHFTGSLEDLPCGYYIARFVLHDSVNNIDYSSGEAVAVFVGSSQTATVTGTLLSAGEVCDINIKYFDNNNTEQTIALTAVVGQSVSDIISSLLSLLDGVVYETSLYTAAEGSGSVVSTSTIIGGNTTYYAHRVKYTLGWNFNGGTPTTSYTPAGAVNANTAIVAPSLTKTGYTRADDPWAPVFTGYMPTANTTYAAQWVANNYTVHYNKAKPANASSDITGSTADSSHVYDTAKNLTTNGYSLTGWSFYGWSITSGGSKVYNNAHSVVNLTSEDNATVNLYTVWTANTYTATFKANGGTIDSGTSDVSKTETYDSVWLEPSKARTGYSFQGWSETSSGSVVSTAKWNYTTNKTFYAIWNANAYQVRFNSNKGSASTTVSGSMSNQNFVYGTAQNLTSNAYTLPGYTFQGWATTSGGSKVYNNGQEVNNLTTTKNAVFDLYAKWTANKYNATFNPNGGTINSSSSNVDKEQTFDSAWSLPANPVRAGYSFGGWNTTGSGSALSTSSWTYQSAQTFKAIWNAGSYTIAFAGSGSGGALNNASYSTSDSSQTRTLTAPTRAGWTLSSYSVTTAGAGSPTIAGTTLTIPANAYGNITITPSWSGNQYSITINNNGATTNGVLASTTYNTSESSQTKTISTLPQKTGYQISSWTVSSAGSGSGSVSSSTLTINALTYGNITITPNFTASTYTVTLLNGLTGTTVDGSNTSTTFTVTYNSTYSALANYTPNAGDTGAVFVGWE